MAYFVYTLSCFEWDLRKAAANSFKHGVDFAEAATVFHDPVGLEVDDVAHSANEARRLRMGRSQEGRVLMVAYATRKRGHGENIRIISARPASRRERARYASPQD